MWNVPEAGFRLTLFWVTLAEFNQKQYPQFSVAYMSVIPTLRKVRQEDHQFEINQHFIVSPCPESKRQTIEQNPNGTIQITSRQTRKVSQCPCRVSFLNRYLYLLNVFMCMDGCFCLCVHLCRSEKDVESPEAGGTDSCEPPCGSS